MAIILNPDLEQRIERLVESGRYQSADEVVQEGLDLLDTGETALPGEAYAKAPLWERISAIGSSVPEEDWAKVPSDLSLNLDHYLYGAPKKSE
jgi:putative addiction module CopG family antidote